MINYYKTKYKKKSDTNLNNNNNAIYVNELFTKNSLKNKADFKFRTTKNSPLYTKRKIEENDELNSGLLTGGRIKNLNNDDIFIKKIKKFKKSGQFSQIHNNSSNLINNNSKNESSSIIINKFNRTKKLFYNNYDNNNFNYNIKLNQYINNNSSDENTNTNKTPNHNISLKQNDKNNYMNNLGLIKHLENKDNKISDTLFKKITNNKQFKNQSVTKIKKANNIVNNINYLCNNNVQNQIDYTKYLKKFNDSNTSGININKIFNPNSFLDYNKLSKTAYLSKNNSGKNSLEKKNVKNNYNIYCFNSKLIQRNDDKSTKNTNNINVNINNESSRILCDSMNKKNLNEFNTSNNNTSNQIYILDSNNKNHNLLIRKESATNFKNKEKIEKIKPIEKEISLYNCINSTKKQKHIYHIKSTSDINCKKIITVNNPFKYNSSNNNNNKINSVQNLNLNSISNNNILIDNNNYNSNTNRTNNDNKTIHFRSNRNIYGNNLNLNINNIKEMQIYKKKISMKQKEKLKTSSLNSNKDKSNSLIENEESSGIKIQSARGLMPKQETIKAKLVKNLMSFKNTQSPTERTNNQIINNYIIDSKKIKEKSKEGEIENDNYRENKSASLINNNYYIGINLDNKLINNICHTFRENNNYFNCNLVSNNNNPQEINNNNNNFIIINDSNRSNDKKGSELNIINYNNSNNDDENNKIIINEKISKKKPYKLYNSQELIKGINKDNKNNLNNKLITIEINKKDYHKRKLLDKKITIKNKEKMSKDKRSYNNIYNDDMLYIPPDKELKQESIHLTTTASLDCFYYKSEKEKLSKYIKRYYKETGSYPETQKNFYLYGRQIGHGAFGKVNIALHVASGRLVAIKTFNKKNLKKKNARQKIKNEISMLSVLRHPFINQILDSFETDTHIFIVMEYICGDLLGFIRKRGKLSETVSKIIFKQLIEGLKYIHHKKIVHRDIKLDNILIDLTNTIKICDFGVSRKIAEDEVMHEHCGTPAYIAPEIFENQGYTGFQCDIWSAGVTLYYILGGVQPFRASSIKDLEKKVILGDFEPLEEISKEANDLIKLMLNTNPEKRINIDKILNHPWLANIKTENRKKLNLFTDAEKILLSKYDVDYLTSEKEELIENFTMKNLETNENESIKNAVGGTKSVIYAPYNTYIDPNEDQSIYKSFLEVEKTYEEIKINNNICKYGFKVQQANIKYELSNNQDFDNGIIKTQKDEDLKHENEKIEKIAFKKNNNSSYENYYKAKSVNDSFEEENESLQLNEKIVEEMEKTVGYDRNYIYECLKKNVINYATATYYLLAREDDGISGLK